MLLKKSLVLAIAAVIILASNPVESQAFGGYAHWEIARRTVDIKYLDAYELPYMSGTLLADIGRATWDSSYTSSDDVSFANKMMEIAYNNSTTSTTFFARGWRGHVYQDSNGDVSAIINDGDLYRVNCGQIDEYLRDTLEIDCPINGGASFWVSYDLIRDTYAALDNFSPTNAEIDEEIENMFLLYQSQILLNASGMSDAQIERMNSQFDSLAQNSYITVYTQTVDENLLSSETDIDIMQRERYNVEKKAAINAIEAEAKKCTHVEVISGNSAGAEVKLVIDDPAHYQKLVEEHASLILSETEFENAVKVK